jgi:hypothetical protein
MAMANGYTIRMTTPPVQGEGVTQELFQVAVDDANQAKMAVRAAARAAPDSIVEIDGELSALDIAQLELEPGQVRRAP